jgi:hypothetical protein
MITNGGAQNRFSFASPYYNGIVVTDPATGSVIWQKFVVFYIYNGKLYRRDVLSVGATTPLTLAQLNTYCNGTGIVVSPSVNSISLVPSAQNNSATLTIITQAVNQNGNLDKQSIITTVYMYNN